MSGRGRGAVLPAWMTKSQGPDAGKTTPSSAGSNTPGSGQPAPHSTPRPNMQPQQQNPQMQRQPVTPMMNRNIPGQGMRMGGPSPSPRPMAGRYGPRGGFQQQMGARPEQRFMPRGGFQQQRTPMMQQPMMQQPRALMGQMRPQMQMGRPPMMQQGFGMPQQVMQQPGMQQQQPGMQQRQPQQQQQPAATPAKTEAAKSSVWTEHKAPTGRIFYFNKLTSVSTYEKPDELKTEEEKALVCDWQEFEGEGGKKYYHNAKLSKSVWEMPEELKEYRRKLDEVLGKVKSEETKAKETEPVATEKAKEEPKKEIAAAQSTPAAAATTVPQANPTVQATPVKAATSNPAVAAATPMATGATGAVKPMMTTPHQNPAAAGGLMQQSPMNPNMMSNMGMMGNMGMMNPMMMNPAMMQGMNPAMMQGMNPAMMQGMNPAMLQQMQGMMGANAAAVAAATPGKTTTEPVVNVSVQKTEKPKKKKKMKVYKSDEERKAAFQECLRDYDIGVDMKWPDVMRTVMNDDRWSALKTLGQKKQVFTEFQNQLKKELREEKRQRAKKAREEFVQMLEQCKGIQSKMRWREVERLLKDDERYENVEDPRDRQDLFDEWMTDFEKKQREERRRIRKEQIEKFYKLLSEKPEIGLDTSWAEVKTILAGDEAFEELDKADRLQVFKDFIYDLEQKEKAERRRLQEEERQIQRQKRDAFRAFVKDEITAGRVTFRSRWGEFHAAVEELEVFKALKGNPGSTPQDLFEIQVDALIQQSRRDRKLISRALKDAKFKFKIDTPFDDFMEAILRGGDLDQHTIDRTKRLSKLNIEELEKELEILEKECNANNEEQMPDEEKKEDNEETAEKKEEENDDDKAMRLERDEQRALLENVKKAKVAIKEDTLLGVFLRSNEVIEDLFGELQKQVRIFSFFNDRNCCAILLRMISEYKTIMLTNMLEIKSCSTKL
eukprot:TRINITY_DN165661_c0_g1_i2.p1 TRINITY_DN165661_c0_g1~~TRINITY_DN165661_c0_g1_i2.p1  ORF type:complete len:960 (-),score=414.83 TRINITY_DN165661_c0_g1_i2:3965-6802(-)